MHIGRIGGVNSTSPTQIQGEGISRTKNYSQSRQVCDRCVCQLGETAAVGSRLSHKGPISELIDEFFFTWPLPTQMIGGIICSVSQATLDVCCGGDNDDIEMGEH